MLCENCQEKVANVHVNGWRRVSPGRNETERAEAVERHFCEPCAKELERTDPLLNPLLKAGPDGRRIKVRITSVTPDRTLARQVRSGSQAGTDDMVFLTPRLPPEYAVAGMEFEITCSKAELEWLQGKA